MPEKSTTRKAKSKLRHGRRPSTAAGEFVREEIHHVREGKHGARSTQQAIAIGLSKARRAGVPLKPPKRRTRTTSAGGRRAASHGALSKQAKGAAARRSAADRSRAARKGAATKGPAARRAAARKAARTRARHAQ